jgi:hypothetical protein
MGWDLLERQKKDYQPNLTTPGKASDHRIPLSRPVRRKRRPPLRSVLHLSQRPAVSLSLGVKLFRQAEPLLFEAVNPTRVLPNILVFVNRDDISDFGDLRETFTGLFHAADGSRHATMPDMAASLSRAKSQIDLCVWIDGKTSKAQGYFFNQGATPNYLNQLCALLGKNPADIKS